MSDVIQKVKKKKKKSLNKSELVNKILLKCKDELNLQNVTVTTPSDLGPVRKKKKKRKSGQKTSIVKIEKNMVPNGHDSQKPGTSTNGNLEINESLLPDSTNTFNNGLGGVSTPISKNVIKRKIKKEPGLKMKKIKTEKPDEEVLESSVVLGKEKFKWMISPTDVDIFFKGNWENRFLHVKRNDPKYYSNLISIGTIDKMLKNNIIEFTKNIDITSYVAGVRETKNPQGRAMPSEVWDFYEQGCSIRLLNPQTYIEEIYKMNGTLQEFFHCMTGANVYLTPANSQGFAPHYDDIEAFVLQVEGKKHWRLYKPKTNEEVLPRYSSENFDQKDVGRPILDVILEAGDMLYFPRGVIHQANTVPGHHSLHITVSVYQKNSWADYFEELMKGALYETIQKSLEFRKGLPLDFHQRMGLVHSFQESEERKEYEAKIHRMIKTLIRNLPIDAAADQIAKRYQHDALPPVLTASEKSRTIFGSDMHVDKNGGVSFGNAIDEDTSVRLVKANTLR